MEKCFNEGAIQLNSIAVRTVLEGGKAIGYEAKKAEKFFKNNPEVRDYAKKAIKYFEPKLAQERFENFCKFSKPVRKLVIDLLLQVIILERETVNI